MAAPHSRRRPSGLSRRLGARVRALRVAARLSQEQLAERSGIHTTYLSSLERGHRNPTLNVLAALAGALDVSLPRLLDGVEK